MSRFVLDASIALAWHFRDERRPETDALERQAAGEGAVVPRHFHIEVANSLLTAERRRQTNIELVSQFTAALRTIPFEVDWIEDEDLFSRILPLARAHGLTIYDAMYLELAERAGLPLATLDSRLASAAGAIGVKVLPQ